MLWSLDHSKHGVLYFSASERAKNMQLPTLQNHCLGRDGVTAV